MLSTTDKIALAKREIKTDSLQGKGIKKAIWVEKGSFDAHRKENFTSNYRDFEDGSDCGCDRSTC